MSEMSYMEKLLEGVEVEWKALSLGENKLTELRRGRVMSKEYLAENLVSTRFIAPRQRTTVKLGGLIHSTLMENI